MADYNEAIKNLQTINGMPLTIRLAIEALEKQIPKKPRETRCALMCSSCGHKITERGCKKLNRHYCKKCGQALDWGDER